MKNSRKIFIMTVLMFFVLSSTVFALADIFIQGDEFIIDGKDHAEFEKDTLNTSKLETGSNEIFNVFLAVGTVVAVIVGAILGIQFMTAGIDKKVEVKQSLFPYIVSCVIMFASFGIWKLIITIMNEVV